MKTLSTIHIEGLRSKTSGTLAALALVLGIGLDQTYGRPLGIDVSSYQGSGVNWTSVKNAGRSFAWAKATEGTTFTDSTFTGNQSRGKSAGVIMGGYHFAHPESASGGTEENHFWAVAGGYIKADGKTLMPMLDMEVFTGHVGASSYSDWANQFNNALVADAKATGVNVTPFIYTSSCSACNFNSSVAGWNADLANYNGQNSQTGNPWNVCTSCEAWGSGVWDAWQYTDSASVSGVSGGVDADVINGSSVSPYTATSRNVAASKLRVDFSADGRDDYAFFRPSDGTWHITFSSDSSTHIFTYGQNGDIPLLGGDFSGDGAADAVVFRPSNATWYVRFSDDASSHSFSFGQSTDIPLLGGDFDDDGSPDAVLFRPSTAMWYVRFSSNGGVHNFSFGQSTDIPLINGDFNGDGAPDAVLFRPSNSTWYVRFSSDASVHSFQFGTTGDIPVLGGDYDGDGAPDAQIFRPSDGTWHIRFSSDASDHIFQFGTNGDKPWGGYITADHKVDAILYRPSTGVYYVRDSVTGTYTSIQLGTSTDIPVH